MKKSMFAKILVMILCLALVLCGCSESAGDSKSNESNETKNNSSNEGGSVENVKTETPEEKADAALERTLTAMFGSGIDMEELENAFECGKITLTVGEYVDNVLYMDTNNMEFADKLSLNIEGVELDVEVYVNEHDLVLALPELVDGAYGISFDTIVTDLPNAAIWDLMGVSYEEFMAELSASLEELTGTMEQLSGLLEGMDTSLGGLEDALKEALANVDMTITEGKAPVGGKDVDAVIVTYSVDSAAMEKIANIMIDWFADYAEDLANSFATMDEDFFVDGEITDAKDQVAAFFENADLNAELVVNINAETGYIMTAQGSFSGTVEGEEGGVFLNVDLGEDLTKSNQYSFEMLSSDDEGLKMTIDREISGDKSDYELTATVVGSGNEEDVLTVSFSYDASSYEYALSVEAAGEELAANGTYKMTDDVFEFSVESVSYGGETMELNVLVKAEAISASEIPEMPEYENVLKMSEDDLMMLMMALSSAFA